MSIRPAIVVLLLAAAVFAVMDPYVAPLLILVVGATFALVLIERVRRSRLSRATVGRLARRVVTCLPPR